MAKEVNPVAVCTRVIELMADVRRVKGISMTVLAKKSGLAQSTISFIENGHRTPTLETLLRIAIAMEVGLGELISRAEGESPARRASR